MLYLTLLAQDEARNNINKIFQEKMFAAKKSELSVRINSIDSGLCETDLETILKGPIFPSTLHLPKMDTKVQLDWLAEKLGSLLGKNHNIKLIVFVESARALLDMKELIEHCLTLMNQGAPFTLEAAVFGSDDFCADIGNEQKNLMMTCNFTLILARRYQDTGGKRTALFPSAFCHVCQSLPLTSN